VLLGLGSILGTGVFVAIGLAAGVAGSGILLALALAAVLAICNGLASAQLAAAHPISGGTYEYGYRVLHPAAGFVAGWMFLCAKTASAATAALGFAGYLLGLFGRTGAWPTVAIGLGACVLLTAVVDNLPTTSYTHHEGRTTPADDFIPKPIDLDKLIGIVQENLGR